MGWLKDPEYRPSEDEPFMNERQREYFRQKLLAWKQELLRESGETLNHLQEESLSEPDITDRATLETDRALELRTRDREPLPTNRASARGIRTHRPGSSEDVGCRISERALIFHSKSDALIPLGFREGRRKATQMMHNPASKSQFTGRAPHDRSPARPQHPGLLNTVAPNM
jgi:DnaK suppressor protein